MTSQSTKSAACTVCGAKVDPDRAAFKARVGRETVYFCCSSCLAGYFKPAETRKSPGRPGPITGASGGQCGHCFRSIRPKTESKSTIPPGRRSGVRRWLDRMARANDKAFGPGGPT